MPASTLSAERLRSLLPDGFSLSDTELDDLLFLSKAELEERTGDELHLSVTPDRLDLLSEAGLASYLGGASEAATGLLRPVERKGDPSLRVTIEPSVRPLRPYFGAVVVHAPTESGLDEGGLSEAVRFQELLHETVGRGRRAASLGLYPLDRFTPPLRYSMVRTDAVRFVPLDGTEEVTAARFYETHAMAARYGGFGRSGDACLVLSDAHDAVLSLPPVLNSRGAGEVRAGDRDILLESTGTSERAVREALGLLQVVFAGRGWAVTPVPIAGDGSGTSDGRAVYSPREVDLASSTLHTLAGEAYPSADVERRLARARLAARPHPGGWRVDVPPWRPDLLTGVDLAEDVLVMGGFRPGQGLLLPSATRGRRRPESRFRDRIRRRLLGLGFAEPHTSLLVGDAVVAAAGANGAIRLQNPVSNELSVLRDRILLSHLEVLGRNTRRAYPQRFAEVGPVIVRSTRAETGAETRYHASLVAAGEGSGFADGAAAVDFLLRGLDVSFVREPVELSGTIPGRAARVRVAGDTVAEIAEIHPALSTALGVPVPVVWAELDLSGLWPLVHRDDTH